MAGKKFEWQELASELCSELIAAVDVEELARATGMNPNTIYCYGYKTKTQIPNMVQFGIILDRVWEENPAATVRVMKKLCARYGMAAESLEALGREVKRLGNGGQ